MTSQSSEVQKKPGLSADLAEYSSSNVGQTPLESSNRAAPAVLPDWSRWLGPLNLITKRRWRPSLVEHFNWSKWLKHLSFGERSMARPTPSASASIEIDYPEAAAQISDLVALKTAAVQSATRVEDL